MVFEKWLLLLSSGRMNDVFVDMSVLSWIFKKKALGGIVDRVTTHFNIPKHIIGTLVSPSIPNVAHLYLWK
jgi:hypothetical protein